MVSEKVAEEKDLRDYEMVLIISPEVTEEKLETIIANITQLVTSKGGTMTEVVQWGKRKLAYPLKHFLEGHYVLTLFKMEPKNTKEMKTSLQISEEVLRYLLINLSD